VQVRKWGQAQRRTTQLLWCLVAAIIVAWVVLVLIGATTT
jgi:predicted nucleic acid-binding Zn ribbon protein